MPARQASCSPASLRRVAAAQTRNVPLSPEAWIATDSIRFVSYLGRPSLYINRGVALARGASMENGTLDLDVAASDTTNFLGVVFRAATPRFSNVLFLRPGASGTEEAVQYGPAFNSVGVAWQVYHGDGANAVVAVARNRWVHVRVELEGAVARLYVDTATAPTLVVPRVAASGGTGLGVWAGAFGRGAYFSNIRYTAAPGSSGETLGAGPPAGYDARLGDLQPDRGRRLHAGNPARARPAHLAARRSGARRVRPDQSLPGGAGGRRAEGQHGSRLDRQRDDRQDGGLADRVRADHHHGGAR